MQINVRLFAGLHDLLGKRDVVLELADGATVSQLRDRLAGEYPVVIPDLSTLVCAVGVTRRLPPRPADFGKICPSMSHMWSFSL